jgi:serine/threonine protein kinase/tetratricopeptide (TPR) repeat protein
MSDTAADPVSSLPLSMEERLEAVCRRFEQAWQAGQRPPIEPYLEGSPPEARAALLRELVALSLEYRRRAGESPTLQEYRDRFPEHATLLEQVLAEANQAGVAGPNSPSLNGGTGERYHALRLHAQGGLGEVQVAEDMELRREVALKRIQLRYRHDPASRRRFLREAEITGRLEHPGIVPVYGLVEDAQGQLSYAMRFIQGETLHEAIQRYHRAEGPRRDPAERRLALRELLTRFLVVCNTIAYAHSRGVLHRDLKPANVMLGKFGETLVVDWGLAKVLDGAEVEQARRETAPEPTSRRDLAEAEATTRIGAAAGTPAYMSPEQAAGRWDQVGPASDIYSLGATLYEILANRPPLAGTTVDDILERAQRGQWVPLRQVQRGAPPALEAICGKAMALQPGKRYATATELAADVERWSADEPVSVHRGTLGERLGRWARRHRTAVVAAMVLVLAAFLGVGLLAWQSEWGRRQLEKEQTATDEARRQAEENAKRERQTIRDYFVRTSEDPVWKTVGLEPLRRNLLQEASRYFQDFIQRHGEEPELLAELAEAHSRLGRIAADLGDRQKACAAYEAALALDERLAAAQPDEPRVRLNAVRNRSALGALRRTLGDRPTARQELDRALKMGEKLAAEHPTEPEYLQSLASVHTNRGELFKDLGDAKSARQAHERAIELKEQLVAAHPKVPEYRSDLAASYRNLGVLLRSQKGDLAGARHAYEQALEILEQLVKEEPRVPQYQWDLGTIHNNLAAVLHLQDDEPASMRAQQRCVEIYKKLVHEHPAVPDYRRDLGMGVRNLGNTLWRQGDRTGAREAFEEALVLRRRLVEDYPEVPDYWQDLARSQSALGILLEEMEDQQGARQAYEKALEAQKKLAADHADVPEYRRELAGTFNSLAHLLKHQDKPKEAQPYAEQGRDLYEELVTQHPLVPDYRRDLAVSCSNLADCLQKQGNWAEALRGYERSRGLWQDLASQHSGVAHYRLGLAHAHIGLGAVLRELGKGEEARDACRNAVAGAIEQAQAKNVNGPILYQCASLSALAAAVVKDDAKLRDQYAAQAVELLQRAVAVGFLDLEQVKEDKDLDSLRGREDFQKLLQEIEKKAKPE